jgi:predicted transcriptional regulator
MSAAILNFIFKYIDSNETIEILLFLRSLRNEWQSVEQISQQLRSNPRSVLKRLSTMRSLGLIIEDVTTSGQYKFELQDIELEVVIQEFAEVYALKPQRIFEILYSPNRQIKDFADAFVIGKAKKKEDDNNG